MRITQLSVIGQGAWPDLQIGALQPQLNVFYGGPRRGKSTASQLVGHLLYGKAASPWRQQFGQAIPQVEGSLTVETSAGAYLLRRQIDLDRAGGDAAMNKLSIAAVDGTAVDSQTVRRMLSGLNPPSAMQLYSVDFAEPPRIEWLLTDDLAREFTHRSSEDTRQAETARAPQGNGDSKSRWATPIDRRRVDELIRRRDAIAYQLQQQVQVRRQESDVLERELKDLESALQGKRQQAQALQDRFDGLETERAAIETRLRYFTLDTRAQRPGSGLDSDQERTRLADLGREIAACQTTLGDLHSREKSARNELAQTTPDGTADSITCLADGRATLGVLEQLLGDLDTEISQLARGRESDLGVGHNAHARLVPVSRLMRQQVYTLCGQLTEQQRSERRRQLKTEIGQLQRAQSGLSERLEQLLAQRESIVRQAQLAGQPVLFVPQPPGSDHCCCTSHGQFVQQSESMVLGRADRSRLEDEAHRQLRELQQDHCRSVDGLTALRLDIDRLEIRWKDLQGERVHLIDSALIEQNQVELERLENKIAPLLQRTERPSSAQPSGAGRASDVLAQLTDGALVQIRLEGNNRGAMVVDRHGRTLAIDDLTPAQHDQLYMALTLALVGNFAGRGIRLPLILDEPFLRQNDAQVAAMAGVLDAFARAGHQVLVFTEDRDTHRRFGALGAPLFDLEQLRSARPPVRAAAPPATTMAAPLSTHSTAQNDLTGPQVVRAPLDTRSTPVLRLAAVHGESDGQDLFFLLESSSWDEIPVLGSSTTPLFASLGLHTVGDLLAASAKDISARLDRAEIHEDTVRLWQIHTGLMCFVPGVSLNDAQLLAACGIESPDDLLKADLNRLWQSIEQLLSSDRGGHLGASLGRCSRSQLGDWQQGARRTRSAWQRARSRYGQWASRRRHGSSRRNESRDKDAPGTRARRNGNVASGSPRGSGKTGRRKRSQNSGTTGRAATRGWRFSLGRASDVEDAPSIGPKTAGRLARVGIRTVADLLNCNPESAAGELGVSHIRPETILTWQHQARLVCQIPELPGYGSQLLVASGFTDPEQIAATHIDGLVGKILAFCQTKEGKRVMRSGAAPERDKIAAWVEGAAHRRPLEAA